jgi:protein TonB
VQVKTEKLTTLIVKPNDEVETPPPSQEQLENAAIGVKKKEGVEFTGIEEPLDKGPGEGKGIVEQKIEKESDAPVSIVEIDAKFLGNWKAFLERNLNGNVPLDNNAPFGRYTVVIQFVVDREGNVSDIKPLTDHGYGMEEEAVRVLRKATKWEPAIQNGYKVKAYHKQSITFVIVEE